MTLAEQIDVELRKLDDKIRDIQTRYGTELTILQAKQEALKDAKKVVKKGLEDDIAVLQKAGILPQP